MHVHVLQHVSFEGLGAIEPWLAERKARVTFTRFHEDPTLPALGGIDLVIALGGPMSVNDEAELPWLVDEKRFLAEAIDRGLAVLGICLGSQLIASARGARVYAAPEKEIGWYPVEGASVEGGSFRFPPTLNVLHWHGETFDLPSGAVHLASSAVCRNQAFQLGTNVIGLQFHLEMTRDGVDEMLRHAAHELVPQRHVQSEAALRAAPDADYAGTQALLLRVLDRLAP